MKIGISTGCWYSLPFNRMVRLISECCYKAISLGAMKEHSNYNSHNGRKNIKHQLKSLDLIIDSLHAPKIDISSPDPSERNRAIVEIIDSIDGATELNCDYVVIHPIGVKWRTEYDVTQRGLNALFCLEKLQKYAEKRSVTLAIENLDGTEQCVFENIQLEATRLGIMSCYDSGHALIHSDPKKIWSEMNEQIRVLHLHDNNGKEDLHNSIGSGNFPWFHFKDWLTASSFNRVIGLECKFRGRNEEEFKNWLRDALWLD